MSVQDVSLLQTYLKSRVEKRRGKVPKKRLLLLNYQLS